jgi:hypothetical protein
MLISENSSISFVPYFPRSDEDKDEMAFQLGGEEWVIRSHH